MTDHEAKYILNKHANLFHVQEVCKEIPDRSMDCVHEIESALKHFMPDYFTDWTCGSCVYRMVEDANKKRKELNQSSHYTFPKIE